jgi:hypothetical protein
MKKNFYILLLFLTLVSCEIRYNYKAVVTSIDTITEHIEFQRTNWGLKQVKYPELYKVNYRIVKDGTLIYNKDEIQYIHIGDTLIWE